MAELSRRKEIFPRLKKLVPSHLHLPGDMRLVCPDCSRLGKHFGFPALGGALPFLGENPLMKCFQTCGSSPKDPTRAPNLSALVSPSAIICSDLQNECHKYRAGLRHKYSLLI